MLLGASHLETVLEPEPLFLVRDVRKLRADLAAVNLLQLGDDLAQLEARLDRVVAAASEELGVEVRLGQSQVVEPEHLRHGAHHEPEGVDVGDQVAPVGVDLDQPRHRALLGRAAACRCRSCKSATGSTRAPARRCTPGEFFHERSVRHVGAEPAHGGEVVAPGLPDRVRIREEPLVHRLNVGSVARRERGGRKLCLEFAHRQ